MFQKKDKKGLIKVLLELERFPFDDPYVGFLRRDSSALAKNPKTVQRMLDRLLEMGIAEILEGATRAKSSSRQFGPTFKNWLATRTYPVLAANEFLKHDGIAILKGGDQSLAKFAKAHLGYKRKKGLDTVLKIKDQYLIGETKFISTGGGTQDKSFRELLDFIKKQDRNTIRIAILDGVVWLAQNSQLRNALYANIFTLRENQIALSALLLEEFINSFS